MINLEIIKEHWKISNLKSGEKLSESQILLFQKEKRLIIPKDLALFFQHLNGTSHEYDDNFFQFYSLSEFKNLDDKYNDWEGIPNYKGILNKLNQSQNIFVFADYNINLFCYAIKLHKTLEKKNDVYVICGEEYRIISNSFSSFIDLYLNDSSLLVF